MSDIFNLDDEAQAKLWALVQRQTDIDKEDAGPKVDFQCLEYQGIVLESRWDVAREYDDMKKIVDRIPAALRDLIESIWCDSNAQACYVFMLNDGDIPDYFLMDIDEAIVDATSGHNGVNFYSEKKEGSPDRSLYLEPHWLGDDKFFPHAGTNINKFDDEFKL